MSGRGATIAPRISRCLPWVRCCRRCCCCRCRCGCCSCYCRCLLLAWSWRQQWVRRELTQELPWDFGPVRSPRQPPLPLPCQRVLLAWRPRRHCRRPCPSSLPFLRYAEMSCAAAIVRVAMTCGTAGATPPRTAYVSACTGRRPGFILAGLGRPPQREGALGPMDPSVGALMCCERNTTASSAKRKRH